MYPKVHNLADANLCWSAVETQGFPNSTEAHRILLDLPTKSEVIDPAWDP
jgi:hypothetical protein